MVSHWRICDSDMIVFYAPLILAFAAYAFLLFSSPWLRPRFSFAELRFSHHLLYSGVLVHLVLYVFRTKHIW